MLSCSFWVDTTVRSIQTWICRMTCAPSGAALVSRQRPHWSLIPRSSQQQYPNCSVLFFPPLCYILCPSMDFVKSLCARSPLALLHQSAGRKGEIKACNFDAGSVATCITSRQKLCCCLGIDINWPFQSLPNSELLSAALLFLFIQGLLKTKHTACRMNPSGLANLVGIIIIILRKTLFLITWQI